MVVVKVVITVVGVPLIVVVRVWVVGLTTVDTDTCVVVAVET